MRRSPLLTVPFLLLAGALFAGVSGNETFNLLPKHLSLQGVPPSISGFVMGFSGLGGIIILPFLAFFVDHFRSKTILGWAMLLNMLVPLLYFVPVPTAALYGIPRGMQGALFAVMMVTFNAAASHMLPDGTRSRGLALFGLMGQAGGLTAIAVGELVFDAGGLSKLYILSLSLFMLSLLLVRSFREDHPVHRGAQPRLRDFADVLSRPALLPPLFWVFILGSGFGTILAFLPDLVLERNLDMVRPFYIAYPITVAVIRLSASHWFDRFPLHWVLLVPLTMVPVSLLTLYYAGNLPLLAIAGACYGVAHGVMFPTLMGHLMDRSPAHFRGRMSSLFNLLFNSGLFISANLGGLFILTTVDQAFLGMAAVTSLGILLLLALRLFSLLQIHR